MAQYNDFEDLPIWQEARVLAKEVYGLTNQGPFKGDRGLRDQVQRAIISAGSNIAEGFDRSSDKDFANFLTIAKSSIAETRSQLYSALDFGYINETEQKEVNQKLKQLGSQIGGFINYLRGSSRTNRRSPSNES
ncbi:four helix bundle protein [Pelagicoccus enzymogenes]|uniref:four helix bundle protein n=1 Tax=Pelagicoccus enzymogenes TaxID=2773457 RepID=UPI00280CC911|nr:four helix bundle protein [Pelagicoccus enzymogenes]MDQ8201106.1 four helix bundle protein [Pelagicoccus enzymogenes]